ncbi:hypothetical protein PR048_012863 [Dryococelus australis]|uniref:Uncharacterized protein n=1 Tax=Dryococelus australis TaxID=614101 RepID=A0ABQ9HQK9_9NEOP|nr:hypothetical protein PR048_012863 [Dryococelus australis]
MNSTTFTLNIPSSSILSEQLNTLFLKYSLDSSLVSAKKDVPHDGAAKMRALTVMSFACTGADTCAETLMTF